MKATGEGLKGFMDWTNLAFSESAKEREAEMPGLVARFSMRMCKRVANAHEEATSGLEVPSGKRSI